MQDAFVSCLSNVMFYYALPHQTLEQIDNMRVITENVYISATSGMTCGMDVEVIDYAARCDKDGCVSPTTINDDMLCVCK